jgi:predicted amidohydrolase
MHAHLIQLDIQWEDRHANFERVRRLLDAVRTNPADLILLPEMFDSGFSLNVEKTADTAGETAAFLASLAKERRCFVHAGTTATASTADQSKQGRNRALTFSPAGDLISTYDKLHPFTYGREGERFARGNRIETWQLPRPHSHSPAVVCPVVCYDLRFPELFRAGLARGTSVFTVVANWPAGRREHWRALLIARAIENQAIVLGVNRCGKDPHLSYLGGSIAVDAQGHVIADAGENEGVLSVELDFDRLDRWRAEFPAWKDQHPCLWPPKHGVAHRSPVGE